MRIATRSGHVRGYRSTRPQHQRTFEPLDQVGGILGPLVVKRRHEGLVREVRVEFRDTRSMRGRRTSVVQAGRSTRTRA